MTEMEEAYLECALWSSCDWTEEDEDNPPPMDDAYTVDNFAAEALRELLADLHDFASANEADIEASGLDDGQVGRDFWLTRNGHGAGFWDRGLGDVGERLSDAARVYGSVDLYSHDGQVFA